MTDSSLIKKLYIKPGQTLAVINAPSGYMERLGELPAGARMNDKPGSPIDFAQIFTKTAQEVDTAVPAVLQGLKHDGMLWVCYPKGTAKVETDLNRDILAKQMEKYGLTAVTIVSIDDVWSALRFRPADKVSK